MTQEIKPESRFWELNALGGVVASINPQYTWGKKKSLEAKATLVRKRIV